MYKRKLFIKSESEEIKDFERRIQDFLDSMKNKEQEDIRFIINNNILMCYCSFYTLQKEKQSDLKQLNV